MAKTSADKGDGVTTCRRCGSDNMFDVLVDDPDDVVLLRQGVKLGTHATVCNECSMVNTPVNKKAVRT